MEVEKWVVENRPTINMNVQQPQTIAGGAVQQQWRPPNFWMMRVNCYVACESWTAFVRITAIDRDHERMVIKGSNE